MIDPIRRGKKIVPYKRKEGEKPSKEIHINANSKKLKSKNQRPAWQVVIIILITAIIMTVLVFGGWFIYGLTQAKNQVITENFSGGAPVLKKNQPPEAEVINERINILLLGNGGAGHSGGGLVDVIQVLSINPKTNLR